MLTALKAVVARKPWELCETAGDKGENPSFCKVFRIDKVQTWVRVEKKGSDTNCVTVQHAEDGSECTTRVLEVDTKLGSTKNGSSKWLHAAWVVDTGRGELRANEFFHELAISWLVQEHLGDLPWFSRSKIQGAVWRVKEDQCRGLACDARVCGIFDCAERDRDEDQQQHKVAKKHKKEQQHAVNTERIYYTAAQGEKLEDLLLRISARDLLSIFLQLSAALCIAQKRIRLKHHDFHVENVLLEKDEEAGAEATAIEIDVPGVGTQRIARGAFRPVIIDFGLAYARDPDSKLSLRRLDEELMIGEGRNGDDDKFSVESDSSWGIWGGELDGDEGYDLAMLVESITEELFAQRPLAIAKLRICSELQSILPTDFTSRGRPTTATPLDWARVFDVLKKLATLPEYA